MTYAVKEVFYTLQGEGANTGRPAVFCRFARCNLWSGREADRSTAICQFCDTDFVGTDGHNGGLYKTPAALADAVLGAWPTSDVAHRFVVLTGGEPMLQVDDVLLDELHARSFVIAIETNGTLPVPVGVDWVCVSPKAGADFVQRTGDELKLVYPQEGLMPDDVGEATFEHRYLSPMDGDDVVLNTKLAIEHCMRDPQWRLNLQTHKYLGIA